MDGILDAVETPAADSGAADTGTPDTGIATTTEPAGGEQQAADAEPQTVGEEFGSYDGRKFGKEFNQALVAIRNANPQYAKQIQALRDGYGRALAISELAPNGVKDIRAWKDAIGAAGGPEGLADLLGKVTSFEELQQKLQQGSAEVFDADEYKGAVPTLAPTLMERFAQSNPEQFQEAMAPHFAKQLATTGLGEFIRGMHQAAEGNQPLQQQLAELHQWYTRNTQTATQGLGGKPAANDPFKAQREALANEQKKFAEQRTQAVWSGIEQEAAKYENDAVQKAIEPYLKSMNLSDERKARFVANVKAGLVARTRPDVDPTFGKTMEAYRKMRDVKPETVQAFVRGKVDAIIDSVVEDEAGYISGGTARKAAPASASNGAPKPNGAAPQSQQGGPIRVAEQPKNLDARRTPDEMLFKNQGYTTDGKLVQWPFKTKTPVH